MVGKTNKHVTNFDLSKQVSTYVAMYWRMAGFKTMVFFRIVGHVQKVVDGYQKILKNISRTSPSEVTKREKYVEDIKKLFDIATPGLEEILKQDRFLDKDDDCTLYREEEGYTRKLEDVQFLLDQRGERKMVMGDRFPSYENRVDASSLKKKKNLELEEGVRKAQQQKKAKQPPKYIDHDENVVDEDLEDDDFIVKPRNRKKKDTVLLELPTDIMNSPEVCAMLDRTGTTSRKAIGVVSSILKSGKIDGKDADLSSFSLSRTGLERESTIGLY